MSEVLAIDPIELLPGELQAWIEAHAFFADIPVVLYDKGNVAMEVQAKQAVVTSKGGSKGVAVIIMPIVADDEYAEVTFGPMTLKFFLQVVEQVELNNGPSGTKKSARRVARKLRDVVKACRLVGLVSDIVMDKDCIAPVPLAEEMADKLRSYAVTGYTHEADGEEVKQVSMPQFSKIDDSGPKLAMECATEGAAIWYSTDGSLPAPNRPGSTLYTVPLPITADATIRAAAFLEPQIGSFVNRTEAEVT